MPYDPNNPNTYKSGLFNNFWLNQLFLSNTGVAGQVINAVARGIGDFQKLFRGFNSPLSPGKPVNPGLLENKIRDLSEGFLIEGIDNTFNPAAGGMYNECQSLKDLKTLISSLSGADETYPVFTSVHANLFLTSADLFLFWPAIVVGENGFTFSTTDTSTSSFVTALKAGASADNQAWHFGPLTPAKFSPENTSASHLWEAQISWDLTKICNAISLRFSKDEMDEEDPLESILVGNVRTGNNKTIVLTGYLIYQYILQERSVQLIN
jgi:hypothetical protein